MKNLRNNNIILGFSIWFQLIQWIDQLTLLFFPVGQIISECPYEIIDQSIGSTETKYIKPNTKTQNNIVIS